MSSEVAGEIPGIVEWIRSRAAEAGAEGCMVGMSGGIDSSVVAALAKRAFPETTLGLIMPFSITDDAFTARARELAEALGVPTVLQPVGPAHAALLEGFQTLPEGGRWSLFDLELPLGNLRSRLRMCLLYLWGNAMNRLVVGTGNKDEDFGIGYFTKYGDGGVDISPIADFHKSEVYALGRALGVSRRILEAPPTAGLWDGQTDEAELGMTYDEIEVASRFLDGEPGAPAAEEELSERAREVVEKVRGLRRRNRHKLEPPPVYRRRA